MRILFVNACPRGKQSRTLKLAQSLLNEMTNRLTDVQVITHDIESMHLQSMNQTLLEVKESLCDEYNFSDSFFRYALEFSKADAVVIAAPYWDLSFPSILKVWVENMYVRNLTFRYEADRCIGLSEGKVCVFVTTAGSPIGENDWGTGYIKAVMNALGIPAFLSLKAQGLDLKSNSEDEIMANAMKKIPAISDEIVKHLLNCE